MAIARYGEVCQRIITEQSNAGRIGSIAHGQRAGRVVARIGERGTGSLGNVSQVDHVPDCKLPADLAAEVRGMIDRERAASGGECGRSRVRTGELHTSAGPDYDGASTHRASAAGCEDNAVTIQILVDSCLERFKC